MDIFVIVHIMKSEGKRSPVGRTDFKSCEAQ